MYAFIDLETSGGKFNKEKIIEIAIIIYDGKKIIKSYSTLVNPCVKVDFYVQKLTGIKNSDLEKENTFNHYAKKVLNLVKDKILVGHNVEYDYRVLKNELKSCKINYNSKTICTIEMARKSNKNLKYYNLNFLCNYFDIELVNHHRALDDATATLNLFKKLKGWILL